MEFHDVVLTKYTEFVTKKHNDCESYWPVIHGFGYDLKVGVYHDYYILIFGAGSGARQQNGIGTISEGIVRVGSITKDNIATARKNIEKYFQVSNEEILFIVKKDMSNIEGEFVLAMQKQEQNLGLSPMKIFLSHKSIDKPTIREYKAILETLGFQVWLDEDAMNAGVELERALLQGFKDSCAAIFFVTPDYIDEDYLASEVNYAIGEKRKKGNKFSLITLVMEKDGKKGNVPELLEPYVWKEPRNELEALREIIRSLPIEAGQVHWK